MINMSYCRYENTFRALQECLETNQDENELSKSEKMYRDRLIILMKDFVEDFCDGDDDYYLEELPNINDCM